MNSSRSKSGSFILTAFQSAAACASRCVDDDTKFQYRWRSPSDSPPNTITVDLSAARTSVTADDNTSSLPALKHSPPSSTDPVAT